MGIHDTSQSMAIRAHQHSAAPIMSNMGSHISKGFRDVDSQSQPHDFKAYLRRVFEVISAQKSESYALLEPSPGKRLLDVGCGTGDDVRALARLVGPTGQSVGV